MKLYQLNQSNLLLTPLYGYKLQFIFHELRPLSSSHGQIHDIVFFPRTKALILLNVTQDYL